jgi:hypothetical protein
MPIFKKKISKMSDYARIFPAKIQNRILLEAITKISGPKLVDYMKQIDTKAAKQFFDKYPDIKSRLNNPLKNKIYPSLLKKAALLTPIFWFGMLPKHEQAKYMQRIKDNLPWNKRKKTQELKTKTELKSSGIKEVRFGVGKEKVISSVPSSYEYKGVVISASCKEEAIRTFAVLKDFSDGMNEIITAGLFDDLKLKQDETQETIFLDSLIRLRGEKLDKVFAEIDIKELKELLDKYPQYKNKIPKKLIGLCENHKLSI